jgi:hypothetical protein
LFVAVYQAHVSVPGPAELWVERQYELEQSDLIFYRYADAPGLPEGVEQPADFLLQLDVAVANIGGRKALVSSLSLLRFIDEHGEAVRLPEVRSLSSLSDTTSGFDGWAENGCGRPRSPFRH